MVNNANGNDKKCNTPGYFHVACIEEEGYSRNSLPSTASPPPLLNSFVLFHRWLHLASFEHFSTHAYPHLMFACSRFKDCL